MCSHVPNKGEQMVRHGACLPLAEGLSLYLLICPVEFPKRNSIEHGVPQMPGKDAYNTFIEDDEVTYPPRLSSRWRAGLAHEPL